jgi:FkbM family methyltransferase
MKYAYLAVCYQLASYLRGVTERGVYTVRSGVAKGLKRRGGFGFMPRQMSQEEAFLAGLDLSGKTIFDVGGYQGIYAMFFARAAGPKGQVVTFEPNPVNHASILDNVQLNGFRNVVVKQMALADRKGTAEFVFPVREPARGTLRADYQASLARRFESRKIAVMLDTLDNQLQLAELPPPNFIKIDVEGAELEVLRGTAHVLEEYRPALFIEVHTGVDVRQLVRLLADADYELSDIEQNMRITPDNIGRFQNGHLYCCARAATLAPKRFEAELVAA